MAHVELFFTYHTENIEVYIAVFFPENLLSGISTTVWKHSVTFVELSKETQMYESMFFESQKTLELHIENKRFLTVIKHQCENCTAIA